MVKWYCESSFADGGKRVGSISPSRQSCSYKHSKFIYLRYTKPNTIADAEEAVKQRVNKELKKQMACICGGGGSTPGKHVAWIAI
jgi:hypothetical protein